MINLSGVVHSPAFRQPTKIPVTRYYTQWVNHRIQTTTENLEVSGTIAPGDTKEMVQTAEGDKIKGLINIYTTEPLYTSQAFDDTSQADGIADEVTWAGEKYKVVKCGDYLDFGYHKSIAIRVEGA